LSLGLHATMRNDAICDHDCVLFLHELDNRSNWVGAFESDEMSCHNQNASDENKMCDGQSLKRRGWPWIGHTSAIARLMEENVEPEGDGCAIA